MPEAIQAPAPMLGAPSFRNLIPTLIIDAALPAIAYQVLTRHGVSILAALILGGIFPAANVVRGFVQTRRLDLIGAIVLVFMAAGTLSSLISGSVMFVLIKESLGTGVFGIVCLSSLLWKRPLMFYFGRQFAAGEDPERIAWWNGLWEYARFRTTIRTITAVWGIGYIVEAPFESASR